MTICIYKNNSLYADGRCTTTSGLLINDNYKKVGYIYEDSETGVRSINKDSLENPTLFAIYAFAGQLDHLQKFLRWFVDQELHPGVDIESDKSFDDVVITVQEDVALQAIVVFKNHNIVREYTSTYEEHLYIDFTKNDFVMIGSGAVAALSIYNSNINITPEDLIKYVCQTSISCGGTMRSVSITDEPDSNMFTILDIDINKKSIINSKKTTNTIVNKIKSFFRKK